MADRAGRSIRIELVYSDQSPEYPESHVRAHRLGLVVAGCHDSLNARVGSEVTGYLYPWDAIRRLMFVKGVE